MRTLQALGVLALLLLAVNGRKLSDKENRQRAVICGKKALSKLHNGVVIDSSEAPWTVAVAYGQKNSTFYQSGMVISDRHVLTNMQAIMFDWNNPKSPRDSFKWRLSGNLANVGAWCNNRTFAVAGNVTRRMGVVVCAGKGTEDCLKTTNPRLPVKRTMYLGNCNESKIAYGIVLLELAKPLDLKVVAPVCVPDGSITTIGETLKAYGIGRGLAGISKKTPFSKVNTKNVTVQTCNDQGSHPDLSVCLSPGLCKMDNGGPVTKTVNGQEYAVASLTAYSCGYYVDVKINNNHVSVGEFSKELCEEAGVCHVEK